MRARSCCCAASDFSPASSRKRRRGACRPTRRPSATRVSMASTATANRSSRARFWAAAPAAVTMPTAAMPSKPRRTRATSRPNSPRRGFRSWSRSWRCGPISAAPASAAAGSATTSITAPWSIAAPSSPPTACDLLLRPQWRQGRYAILRHRRCRSTPHDLGGLVDGEPVRAGQIVRVVTTGGGGWGDPLEREPDLVQRDVLEGKVSLGAARDDYGVALRAPTARIRWWSTKPQRPRGALSSRPRARPGRR